MRAHRQVLVFPAWEANPFLNLLALSARASGSTFIEATTWPSLVRQLRRLGRGDVLHIHWTSPIVQAAADEHAARGRLDDLRAHLAEAHDRGVRVIWTVHNRLPHELAYPEAEIELYRLLARASDAIHVMSQETRDVVADVVSLPAEKIRHIPHPSYEGVYDTGIGRGAARDRFDLGSDDLAVLFFGQIRPYKGVDSLIAAVARAQRPGRDVVLLLAGSVKDVDVAAFVSTIPASVRVVSALEFIPDQDIPAWFSAADVAVFPYRAILNSGSVHLAATYGVPVLLPGEDHLRRQFSEEKWVGFFDADDPVSSIAACLGDPRLFAGVGAGDFAEYNRSISPWAVSRRYDRLLSDLTAR